MRKDIDINSEITNIRKIENVIDDLSSELKINRDAYGKILVATLEAVNNAIIHGNKTDKSKYVKVGFDLKKSYLAITVEDEGSGFNPGKIPDPTAPGNIEKLHGRGIYLMRNLADDIEFNPNGNLVKMTFNIV
ncbi:MAG: ATP-binding protein [Bacteroidales bacterium]|nr:ATP-binding protein [Bacteroidales bacterium]